MTDVSSVSANVSPGSADASSVSANMSSVSANMIEVSGLTKAFSGGTLAVGGLDLTFEAGRRHAVIGPNGAGKTTLLNLIAGELRPTAGRIRYNGRDVTRTSRVKRSRLGIARTFQQPTVWSTLSVADNIALAAWPHSKVRGKWRRGRYRTLSEYCERYLETAGITALADRPAGALAHGERRMLDIGMALAAEPRVLLLDEPAAGLTDQGVERLLTAMRALPQEVTVIVVEHDFAFVSAVADTVTVLQDGKLLATGTPTEIAADAAVRTAYLGESGVVPDAVEEVV
ncbi:ABC transporter ATP-binding protein [Catenulispora sp. NF23]|uniref:ABC transporter ATP-binding protein n=1 Tax=Catenulispora pinistramenti TaxID=2705254 RepID=A0ABS5L5E6_9ACTN|nr:ABC transporter ATP-binding protein [Catenulispora pinistramenti]MBS2539702.1 ABC transporter ATP-binding protein [Catenulispora pinistramenti]MBS2553457.1 ABC transporter ATP-binding protein [Catenulispora pinistramenti]